MTEHGTHYSKSGEEQRRIPQTPRPAASRPYLPPAGHIEANLAQSGRTYDQNVDGDLAPPVGENPGSGSGNTELVDTTGPVDSSLSRPTKDQSGRADYDGDASHRSTDIPDSTASQGSQDEGAHQEENHDDSLHERRSTRSRSPSNPLSPTDDESGTDATEYGEVEGGMDAADGLPDWRGEE